MQLILLLLFGSYISRSDILRHVIPNSALIAFASSALMLSFWRHDFVTRSTFSLKVAVALFVLNWLTAGVMGMGDLKYLALLSFLVGSSAVFLRGSIYSIGIAGLFALFYLLATRDFKTSVPLAPSITMGYLLALVI